MIQIGFSPEDINQLEHLRFYHEHPRVRMKMMALWLKSQNLKHSEICHLINISKGTLISYLKQYQEGGIEQLKEINFYQPQSEMAHYVEEIKAYFIETPPMGLREASFQIERITGLKRSEVQVSVFLRQLGFKARRVASLPAKVDPEKQVEFLEKNWSLC